eukprot:COSAG05_NODE_188_length_14697_cov_11.861145_4_plen_139_part_00
MGRRPWLHRDQNYATIDRLLAEAGALALSAHPGRSWITFSIDCLADHTASHARVCSTPIDCVGFVNLMACSIAGAITMFGSRRHPEEFGAVQQQQQQSQSHSEDAMRGMWNVPRRNPLFVGTQSYRTLVYLLAFFLYV